MSVQDAIGELYGLAPGEFVAARTVKVRELRAAGERDAAAVVVAKLRRPSVNQWALNMAARAEPEIAARWSEAAAAARDAQEAATSGSRVDLRGALKALRECTSELKTAAAQWASGADLGLTLNELASSADGTEALRAGMLGADQHSSSDAADRAGSPLATRPSAGTGRRDRSSAEDRSRQRRVAKARAVVERSQSDLDDALAAVAETAEANAMAQAALAAAAAAVEDARRQLASVEAEQATADGALRATVRAHASAVKRLDRAQQAHAHAVERYEDASRST